MCKIVGLPIAPFGLKFHIKSSWQNAPTELQTEPTHSIGELNAETENVPLQENLLPTSQQRT